MREELKKEQEKQVQLQQDHLVELGKKDEENIQVRLNYEKKLKDIEDAKLKKEHEDICNDDHTAEEHASERDKFL